MLSRMMKDIICCAEMGLEVVDLHALHVFFLFIFYFHLL